MQSFFIKRNQTNYLDVINFIRPSDSNHYTVVYEQPKDSDFTIISAHSASFSIPPFKTVVIAMVSYVPNVDSEEWPQFYVNICRADILAIDQLNKEKLTKMPLPEKRFIITDAFSFGFKKIPITKKDQLRIKNVDPNKTKLWDAFVEFIATNKKWKKTKISVLDEPADIGMSFSPLGYNLAHCLTHNLPFLIVENSEHSRYLDCRCNTYLHKILGNMININGRGFNAQIKDEFNTFMETTTTLLEHIQQNNDLVKFDSTINVVDAIFHSLNSMYSNA